MRQKTGIIRIQKIKDVCGVKIKKSISVLMALLLCILIPSIALASTLAQPESTTQIDKSEILTEQNNASEIIEEITEQKEQEWLDTVEETEEDIYIGEKEQINEQPINIETPEMVDSPNASEFPEEIAGIQREEAALPYNTTGYEVLEDGISAIVYTFAQLKEAIEQTNGIQNVYLGADILIEVNDRIQVSGLKQEIKISGQHPFTNASYTLTLANSNFSSNILVSNSGQAAIKKVTLENISIISESYGPVYIDASSTDVELVFRNVIYHGKQFAYNPYGAVFFEGSNQIYISGASSHELAEAKHVVIRGILKIEFESVLYHVFKMDVKGAHFTVEGALYINALKIDEALGVIESGLSDNAVTLELLPEAKIYITANTRLFDAMAKSIIVGEGATFHFEKIGGLTGTSYAAIGLYEKLVVEVNATFYASQSTKGASYLFWFGASSNMTGGVMEFNNPKHVTLINEGDRQMVYGQKAEEFNAVFEYMQYWNKGKQLAGEPTYSFTKEDIKDGDRIWIKLTHKAGVVSSIASNHSDITADVMKLDATPGIIIFGQLPEDETISTLIFSGQHELTGETVAEFGMESQVVERYAQILIIPQKIAGYVATGFSVNLGPLQRLIEGQAVISPSVKEEHIVFYYSEPVIEVSMPTKLIFTAEKGNDGKVISPEYAFINNSNVTIEIVLTNVVEDKNNVVTLAKPEEENTGQLALHIEPANKEQFAQIDLYGDMQAATIGTLQDRWQQNKKDFNFSLSGKYYGNYLGGAKWPKYQLEFAFRVV